MHSGQYFKMQKEKKNTLEDILTRKIEKILWQHKCNIESNELEAMKTLISYYPCAIHEDGMPIKFKHKKFIQAFGENEQNITKVDK